MNRHMAGIQMLTQQGSALTARANIIRHNSQLLFKIALEKDLKEFNLIKILVLMLLIVFKSEWIINVFMH